MSPPVEDRRRSGQGGHVAGKGGALPGHPFSARGYRLYFSEGKMKGTGLLVVNSFPTGAQVYVNDTLLTATDNTLNLNPGTYKIKIIKDGYLPWEKNLKLEKELVTQTNTLLFPVAPDLQALTLTGAIDPVPSPDGQKIAYKVASSSASSKNGLFILQMSGNPLSFKANIQQIANPQLLDIFNTQLVWSPDSSQILAYQTDKNQNILNPVLLEVNKNNLTAQDQTSNLITILDDWEKESQLVIQQRWKKLPEKLQLILEKSADNLYWSPDEKKILYTATDSATIPENLIPPLPASSTQKEERQLKEGGIYVYDLKEDKNFYITTTDIKSEKTKEAASSGPLIQKINHLKNLYSPIFNKQVQWFPNSRNLIISKQDKILSKEYDGTNEVTIYAGPMQSVYDGYAFVFPWPDASKLVILTSLNSDLPPNLYAIKLK